MSGRSGWVEPGHDQWEELAVGRALRALEPADDEAFRTHLGSCARCERLVLDVEQTAAGFAHLARLTSAPERLRRAVLALEGVEHRSGPLAGAPRSSSHQRSRWSWPTRLGRPWVGLTVGMVVLVAVVLWNLVVEADNRAKSEAIGRLESVVRCAADSSCRQIPLSATTASVTGLLAVRGDHVTVVLSGVTPNAASTTFYLWQQPADGSSAVAVGAFDLRCGGVCVVDLPGALAVPLSKTREFVVTLEVAKPRPHLPAPTPIAVGAVTRSS